MTRILRLVILTVVGIGLAVMLGTSLHFRLSQPLLELKRGSSRANPAPAATGRDLSHAVALCRQGDVDQAESLARQLALENPRADGPLRLLAYIEHLRGRHALAAQLLRDALARRESASTRYSLGVLHTYFLQQPADGREQFVAAMRDKGADPALLARIRRELAKNE